MICPRIVKRLENLKKASSYCYASYSGGRKFEVKQLDMQQFTVDTQLRTSTG